MDCALSSPLRLQVWGCREDLEAVLGKIQEVGSLLRERERELDRWTEMKVVEVVEWIRACCSSSSFHNGYGCLIVNIIIIFIYIYIYVCMYESTTPISHIYKYMFSYYLFHWLIIFHILDIPPPLFGSVLAATFMWIRERGGNETQPPIGGSNRPLGSFSQ